MEKTEIDYKKLKAFLEGLYYVYARRELLYPDPLWYLYKYEDVRDREIVGLIASSLAYGRVAQIMKSVDRVLSCLGTKPREFLLKNGDSDIVPSSFKHRFTTSYDMNNFLRNIRKAIIKYDTIENLLASNLPEDVSTLAATDEKIFEALDKFSAFLTRNAVPKAFPMMSRPLRGSAGKRLYLFLRWLIRSDNVDPGGWHIFSPAQLLIPCDTHILNISAHLGFIRSRSPSINSAVIISNHFYSICPHDTAKYDFVLTRFGLRSGLPVQFTYSVFN